MYEGGDRAEEAGGLEKTADDTKHSETEILI
jgi:hypothetical protein